MRGAIGTKILIDDVPTTLTEFTLMDEGDGTRSTGIESGFAAALPPEIRELFLLDNTEGWEEQMGTLSDT
ncbi:MAG: hypothetical protein R2855_13400 [Thermomicrobiales bacterium]